MENTESRLLGYPDIDLLFDYFQESDLNDSTKFYTSHKLILSKLQNVDLRRAMFDYKIIVYAKLVDGQIDSFVMFSVPSAVEKTTAVEILAMTENDFVLEAMEYVKRELEYRGWTKAKINFIKIQENDALQGVLSRCGFEKEVEVKSHDESLDYYEYSYMF